MASGSCRLQEWQLELPWLSDEGPTVAVGVFEEVGVTVSAGVGLGGGG